MHANVYILLLYCTCIVAFQASLWHLVPYVAPSSNHLPITGLHSATTGDVELQSCPQIKLKDIPFGRPHSLETKARISASNKGKVPWNAGIKHSPETKARIAQATKEATQRKKAEIALVLGMTVEEYDSMRAEERDRARRAKLKGGLSEEGKRRISESMKRRWAQPVFRDLYIRSRSGFRNHTQETKDRISALIKLKWKDENYRNRCSGRGHITDDVRRKISESLKARWLEPEFRTRMLNSTTGTKRTEAQKARISQSVRLKWRDPVYRSAIEQSLRRRYNITTNSAACSDISAATTTTIKRSASTGTRRRQQAACLRERKFDQEDEEERVALAHKKEEISVRLDQRASRSAVLNNAKQMAVQAVQSGGAVNMKALLGDDLWFEEKMLHKVKGQTVPMDDALNDILLKEWGASALSASKSTIAGGGGDGTYDNASRIDNLGTGTAGHDAGSSAAQSGILYTQSAQPRGHAQAAPVSKSLSEIKQAALNSDSAIDGVSTRIEGMITKPHKMSTTRATTTAPRAALRDNTSVPSTRANRSSVVKDKFAEDLHRGYGCIDALHSDVHVHAGVSVEADEEEDGEEDKIEMYDARGKLVGVYTPHEYASLCGGMKRQQQ